MPFSSKKAEVHSHVEFAENAFEQSRNQSLGNLSLQELFTQARNERDGLKYMTKSWSETVTFDPYGGNNVGPLETETIEHPSVEATLPGDPKRYQQICEVIATKLIYCDSVDLEAFKKNCTDDPADKQTQKDVYQILKDKYRKSVDDFMELSTHYPEKNDREKFVEPLRNALRCDISSREFNTLLVRDIKGKAALKNLRQYTETLLNGSDDNPSIAKQLKDTGDHIAIKILKGIVLTLGTGLLYGIYALKQAIQGEASYAFVDNPAERLAKNAEKRLFPAEPQHYRSMQHMRTETKEPHKTTELEEKVSFAPSPTNRGPG